MGRITVTIINWKKYNPRSDVKTPVWFALSNRIVEDPDLYNLDPLEFKAFVYILCQASQKKSPTISIHYAHAEKAANVEKSAMMSAIEKLSKLVPPILLVGEHVENFSMISPRTDIIEDAEQHTTLHYKTVHNKTNTRARREEFDFEEIYLTEYPRKEGKELGFERLRSQIKTQSEFELFCSCVREYARLCRQKRTEMQYIKLFSSFVGTAKQRPWRDYIPKPKPALPLPTNTPQELTREPITPEQVARNAEQFKALMKVLGKVGT